jgi:AAHS family 3-hydroxyphenylpropionic acid transporter
MQATQGSTPLTGRVAIVLALCAAATLVEGFDIQSAGLVAPQYGKEFHISHAQQGAIFGLNNLGLFVGSLLAGWTTDKLGRRWTAILSMVVFGAFSVAGAFAHNSGEFTITRVCLGLGLGGSMTNIVAITAEAGSLAGRVVRVTIMTAGIAVGGAIPGLVLGFWPHLSWRFIYQLGGWLPIGVGLLMFLLMPESAPYLKAKMEAAAAPGGETAKPKGARAILSRPMFGVTMILWTASFLIFLVYYVINNWLPSLLVERNFSTREASFSAALFTTGGAIGTVIIGLMLAHRSRTFVSIVAFSGCLVALLALAFVTRIGLLLPVVFTLGLFVTTCKNMIYGFAPLYYPVEIRGTGVGAALSWGRIGSIVGPAGAGVLLGMGLRGGLVALVVTPILILAMAAFIVLSRRQTEEYE